MGKKVIKIELKCGAEFDSTVNKAKEMAEEQDAIVEYDFNDVKCRVDNKTNGDWLYRDYLNAGIMGWKVIGPKTIPFYDSGTDRELKRRREIREEKEKIAREEYNRKQEIEKAAFNSKIDGIDLELSDIDRWENMRAINGDAYGKATLDYAEGWAKLMQVEMSKGNKLEDIAEKTSFELGFMGITGFMYGCAVNTLAHCWKYGEELRVWHNKKYNLHERDGVVNPAYLTFN